MRLSADAPVSWPSGPAWDAWWQHETRHLPTSTTDEQGYVDGLEDELPPGTRLRLTAGEHLRAGALYEAEMSGVTTVAAAGGIGGPDDRRLVHAQLRHLADERRVVVDLDGLDGLRSLRASSDLQHLAFDVSASTSSTAPFDVELRLDWLRVHLSAAVEQRGADAHLVVTGTMRGRGRWRPVLAPFLAAAGSFAAKGLRSSVEDAAAWLSSLEGDPTGERRPNPEQARTHRARTAAAIMSARATTVADQMAAGHWWRRRNPQHWLRALHDLPEPDWPRAEELDDWESREQDLLRLYATRHRRSDPPRWVGDELLRRHAAQQEALERSRAAAEVTTPAPAPLTDASFDLAWLVTPWSMIRRSRDLGSDAEAEAALRADLQDGPT
ncbi:hypothetical protein ACHAAC_07595 [Aeromicrobium sp. CF4.19]|uniref:hypothetical protein n=1 Tax=Aeromicrobium sp. CF4.19 TaxID=3373082 RepID=UPI003EE66381